MTTTIIEKLLAGAEVEWKPLGEVVEISDNARRPIKAALRKTGRIPYFGANNIQDYVEGYTHDGEFVLVAEDGSKSLKNYSIQWAEGKFWANNHVHIVRGRINLNNRFLFHFLKSLNFVPYLSGGTRAKLTKFELVKIPLPIPPLSFQKEIVRILDAFTVHTAELTAELTDRQKQYKYYRDKLLTFSDDEVEWKTLGEIFNLKNGYTPSKAVKEYWENGDIPWFRMEDLRNGNRILSESIQKVNHQGVKGRLFPKNSIIMATSATIGEHALITVDYLCNQRFTVFSAKEKWKNKIDAKFIFYYFFIIGERARNNISISSFPSVQMDKLKKANFPIPPLSVQKEIVRKLDAFSDLTTSITEGLPREIELRQKQYRYYRDQLLNFPTT